MGMERGSATRVARTSKGDNPSTSSTESRPTALDSFMPNKFGYQGNDQIATESIHIHESPRALPTDQRACNRPFQYVKNFLIQTNWQYRIDQVRHEEVATRPEVRSR